MESASDFRARAERAFAAFVDEGLALNPAARPSHLCIRSATDNDFIAAGFHAATLGTLFRREHNDQPIIWVKLLQPLMAGAHTLDWLEFPAPKADAPFPSGPQMLVYKLDVPETIKRPSAKDPSFILRFQAKSAEELVL